MWYLTHAAHSYFTDLVVTDPFAASEGMNKNIRFKINWKQEGIEVLHLINSLTISFLEEMTIDK